jgi:hypothetical protein
MTNPPRRRSPTPWSCKLPSSLAPPADIIDMDPLAPTLPSRLSLTPERAAFCWAVTAAMAVAAISRLCFLFDPFKNDAGIYIYFGKVLYDGGKLYHDFWDTKLPSIALLTAPLYAIFKNHWWPYVLLQLAMGIGAAWIFAVGIGRYVGRWAFAPALLFGLVGFNFERIVLTGFQLETVQLFFESIAAVAVLRSLRRPGLSQVFVAGLLVGLAVMPKPGGLAVGAAAACAYLCDGRRTSWRTALLRILALAAGVAIPILLVVIWVATQPWRSEMPQLLKQIQLYGSGTPWRRLAEPRAWVFFLVPFSPLPIRWALGRFSRGRAALADRPDHTPIPTPLVVFSLAWCVAEVAMVVLQRRLYSYHYLVIMPALVLAFALARPTRLTPILIAIAPIAALSLIFSVPNYRMFHNRGPMPISRYVQAHTTPTDAVWADPAARLLLETNRPPGSRLQMTFYLVNHDDAPRLFGDQLLQDFEQRKPKYIVLLQDWTNTMYSVPQTSGWMMWLPARTQAYLAACHRIDDYIHTHYHLETTLDGRSAWRRRDAQTGG